MEIITLNHHEFKNHVENSPITHHYYQTPAGPLHIAKTPLGIFQASFSEPPKDAEITQLIDVTQIILVGTEFQIRVWQELLTLPAHTVISYQELAMRVGRPNSWRAVANAVGQNNIAYFVPCHLVVRKDGTFGGYRWGVERKAKLLANAKV